MESIGRPIFPLITACGHAAKLVLFEVVSPLMVTRNKREFPQYFYKYECCGKIFYKGVCYPLILRLINHLEPQKENELRLVENPRLTRRIFRVRQGGKLLELNPRVSRDHKKMFWVSCLVVAHAIHGRAFFPSPSQEKKLFKNRRQIIDY